jgi:hypothetical protein
MWRVAQLQTSTHPRTSSSRGVGLPQFPVSPRTDRQILIGCVPLLETAAND